MITKFQVKKKGDDLSEVKIVNPENEKKWKKITSGDWYAVVVDGQPYIATKFGYFPIIKNRDDLLIKKIFQPKKSNFGLQIGLGLGFGMMGVVVSSMIDPGKEYIGPMIIDHLNGALIFL